MTVIVFVIGKAIWEKEYTKYLDVILQNSFARAFTHMAIQNSPKCWNLNLKSNESVIKLLIYNDI